MEVKNIPGGEDCKTLKATSGETLVKKPVWIM
jgi:hypothetical protein